jgi:hypothetical protein
MRGVGRYAGLLGLAFLCVLGGCGEKSTPPATAASAGNAAVPPPVVSGTALPPGYKIDDSRTLILGADERWTGRLSYTTSTSSDDVFDFLRHEMPNFGWAETGAMRSDTSMLTFASDSTGRVAMISIQHGGSFLGGSTRVEMVVSPKDSATTSAAVPARPPQRQPRP